MTISEEINKLTFYNLVNKLKTILQKLLVLSNDNMPTYKEYNCIVTQSGTDSPTIKELKNSLGVTVSWSGDSQNIIATFSSDVDTDKIQVFYNINESPTAYVAYAAVSANDIAFELHNIYTDPSEQVYLDGTMSVWIKIFN